MEIIKKVKIKNVDGTYLDNIPIGTDADNVLMQDGKTLTDTNRIIEDNISDLKLSKTRHESIIDILNKDNISTKEKLKNQETINEDQAIEIDKLKAKISKTKAYIFDNVEEMKNADFLKNGDSAETLGYYEIDDGGAGIYKIISILEENDSEILLNNGLKAKLINNLDIVECYGINANLEDNSSLISRIQKLEKIKFSSNKEYKFSTTIVLNNRVIEGNQAILKYTGNSIIEEFIKIDGEAKPNTPGSGCTITKELFVNGNDKSKIGIVIDNSYAYLVSKISVEKVLEKGILLKEHTNGKIEFCRVRCVPNPNIETIGFYCENADSIINDCKAIDFRYGTLLKNGNYAIDNFHAWLSTADLYDSSSVICIDTFASIMGNNITADTVKTLIKTKRDFTRFSFSNVNMFNNANVITSDITLLDLNGITNNINISGGFATTQSEQVKIFSDDFINKFASYNFYNVFNQGNYNINIDTNYIKNYPLTKNPMNLLSAMLGNSNVSMTDLNITRNGYFTYAQSTANIPSSLGGVCLVLGYENTRGMQIAMDTNGEVFTRYISNKTYGSWKKLS